MYPLLCIDIRNLINQFYFFTEDYFPRAKIIDDELQKV